MSSSDQTEQEIQAILDQSIAEFNTEAKNIAKGAQKAFIRDAHKSKARANIRCLTKPGAKINQVVKVVFGAFDPKTFEDTLERKTAQLIDDLQMLGFGLCFEAKDYPRRLENILVHCQEQADQLKQADQSPFLIQALKQRIEAVLAPYRSDLERLSRLNSDIETANMQGFCHIHGELVFCELSEQLRCCVHQFAVLHEQAEAFLQTISEGETLPYCEYSSVRPAFWEATITQPESSPYNPFYGGAHRYLTGGEIRKNLTPFDHEKLMNRFDVLEGGQD